MKCPSDKCQSTNVQHLPHYWESLPSDSPLKGRYAQPAEADGRVRLALVGAAALGVVFVVTGGITGGLVLLAVGAAGAWVAHGRVTAVEEKRAEWGQKQICLACTHLWVP